jgi:hypothetical protein
MKAFKSLSLLSPDDKRRIYDEIISRCQLAGDCWVYPVKNSSGYGMKWIGGKMMTVSRFVLAYHTRESLSIKLDACHVFGCPYRACCNPKHLIWGTHAENAAMREEAERMDRYDPRWAVDPPLGHVTHGVDVQASWKPARSTGGCLPAKPFILAASYEENRTEA